MRKLLILLAVLLLLTGSAMAYEIPDDFTGQSLESVMDDYIQASGLSAQYLSVSYYNTVTGESYDFNEDEVMTAASTYKLPLNMYYYEMEQAGEITGDTIILNSGMTLSEIHERSIVYSDNDASEYLIFQFGKFRTYRDNMRKYLSATDAELDPAYYQGSNYSTGMMMEILKYLYENRENFEELIDYMKIARPGEYFKAGVTDYEVAHKYGSLPAVNNDVGIIFTPQPILLAVYTKSDYGAQNCAEIAALLTAYTVWQAEQNPVEPETEETVEDLPPEQEETPAEESEPEQEDDDDRRGSEKRDGLIEKMKNSNFPWWVLGVVALALLLVLLRFL